MTGVRHAWTFDDMFSAFATQGLDPKKKGEFTREELAPLAKVNVKSLKEYDYFTYRQGERQEGRVQRSEADYYLDYNTKETVLTLHFTLPFKAPVKAKELSARSLRSGIFRRLLLRREGSGQARRRARACKLSVARPQEMGAALGAAAEPARSQPAQTPALTVGAEFANKIVGEMSVKPVVGGRPVVHFALVIAALAGLMLVAGALDDAFAQGARSAARARRRRAVRWAAWSAGCSPSRPSSIGSSPA